jgi:poly-beta-1,6-N-acetyl-D-glucosamine N-deacetylase
MNNIIVGLIYYSGIFHLFKRFIFKKNVSIVLYHDPKTEVFKKHVNFLNRHYNFISIDLLVDAIHNKDWSKIPNNSLVITFDDGHIGNYSLINILKEYNIKSTFYCCSNIIGSKKHFWWKNLNPSEIEKLKKLSNKERLKQLKIRYDYTNDKDFSEIQALTKDHISELTKISNIGSHTKFHPVLTCCDSQELNDEIYNSKRSIERITDATCDHFCYPNGDYNNKVINVVKKTGYKSARTIDVGWNNVNTDPYKLKISGISDEASLPKLVAQLTGITMFIRYFVKGGSLKGLYKSIKVSSK